MKGFAVRWARSPQQEYEFMREFISQTGKFRALDPDRCVLDGEPPSRTDRQGRSETDLDTVIRAARSVR